jgi:hypothetical protein
LFQFVLIKARIGFSSGRALRLDATRGATRSELFQVPTTHPEIRVRDDEPVITSRVRLAKLPLRCCPQGEKGESIVPKGGHRLSEKDDAKTII